MSKIAKVSLFVIGMAALAVLLIFLPSLLQGQELPARDIRSQMQKLSRSLDSRMVPQEYWMDDFNKYILPNGHLNSEKTALLLKNYAEYIDRVPRYSQISEARDLADVVVQAVPGAVREGQYPVFRYELFNPAAFGGDIELRLKVLFFGSSQTSQVHREIVGVSSYVPFMDAVLMQTLRFSSLSFADAVFNHELKHAQQWQLRKRFLRSGQPLPPMVDAKGHATDLGATLEVEAYRLSGKILDAGTDAKYSQRIQQVVQRRPAASPHDLMLRLRPDDLVYLDEIFPRPGRVEAGLRRFLYLFSLGDAFISSPRVPGTEARKNLAAWNFFRDLASAQR